MGFERKKAIAVIAAALMSVSGVCFGVAFFMSAPRELPDTALTKGEKPSITKLSREGEAQSSGEWGAPAETADISSDASADTEADSSVPDSSEKTSQDSKKKDSSSSQAQSAVSTGTNVTSDSQRDGRKEDSSLSSKSPSATDKLPDVPEKNVPKASKPSGGEVDEEFFTTSIKDGETVSSREYFFTVTHLRDDLTPRDVTVEVNGGDTGSFEGICLLEEGLNRIRVTCSYTDSKGAVSRAYKDYTVSCVTGEVYITTDLTDMTVDTRELTFTAAAHQGDKDIPLRVRLGDREVQGEGSYHLTLNEGDNLITLSADSQGKSAQLSFTVTYSPERPLSIVTDLTEGAVYGTDLAFSAYTSGGRGRIRLTVQVNGSSVKSDSGEYNVTLNYGDNRIRLIARDDESSLEQQYVINCLPEYSPEELPYFEKINITDGMNVRSSALSLIFTAADASAQRIYSDKAEVWLNGERYTKKWEDSTETGYILSLTAGDNTVYITLTDSLGRVGEYYFTIHCDKASQGEEIARISLSCEASWLGIPVICADDSFPVYEGESGFDTVKRFLEENGFEVYYRGSDVSRYLYRISKSGAFSGAALTDEARAYLESRNIPVREPSDGDSLGEFDFSQGSGWIYMRNGKIPAYTLSSAVFGDGEQIRLLYSIDYSNDLR